MMTKKLKPCPFCGGEAQLAKLGKQVWVMRCTQCECKLNQIYKTEQQAIEAWNRREPMDKIVEQLEELKKRHFLTMANTGDDKLDLAYEYVGNALDTAIEIVKSGGCDETKN